MGVLTAQEFVGGATNVTSNADIILNTSYRFWCVINTGATTVKVIMPPTATLGLLVGSPIFVLANVGATAFVYRDFEQVAIEQSLPAGKAIIISTYLIDCMVQWALHGTPSAFVYTSY